MNKLHSIILIIIVFLYSCSSPVDVTNESISVYASDKYLHVTNHHNKTLYFSLIESEWLPYINWATHFEEPNIPAYCKGILPYKHLRNRNSELVKKGDRLSLLFWDDTDKKNPQINSVIIDL